MAFFFGVFSQFSPCNSPNPSYFVVLGRKLVISAVPHYVFSESDGNAYIKIPKMPRIATFAFFFFFMVFPSLTLLMQNGVVVLRSRNGGLSERSISNSFLHT